MVGAPLTVMRADPRGWRGDREGLQFDFRDDRGLCGLWLGKKRIHKSVNSWSVEHALLLHLNEFTQIFFELS